MPGLWPHLWLCLSSWDSGCCPRVSVAPYCWFDLQLPALAHSLPFLPPGIRGRAWETRSGLLSPCVTLGLLPPPLHPQKPSTTPVWGSSLHSQRDWDQLVGKSCFQPSWLGLGLGRLLCCTPNPLGWEGCANRCLPCRAQRSWLPGLRTLLLAPLLSYLSVPFLVRLFPSVLTKFVYLNFREYPSQEKPPQGFSWLLQTPQNTGGTMPGQYYPIPAVLWACRGGTEGIFPRVLQALITWCCRPCFPACSHNTPGQAQHQRGWKFGWEEAAEG